MLMLTYSGDSDDDFTYGKVYIASMEMDCSDVVVMDDISVTCDQGDIIQVSSCMDLFEILDSAYAVVVREIGDFKKGDVVQVYGGGRDDTFIVGPKRQYCRRVYFRLLDKSVIHEGFYAMDRSTGKWLRIDELYHDFRVCIGGVLFSPLSFVFHVVEGKIKEKPLVKCINHKNCEADLTEGRIYEVREGSSYHDTILVDCGGSEHLLMTDRFVFV